MEQNTKPKMSLHLYRQIIYDEGSKPIKWGKRTSSINSVGKTGQVYAKKSNWTSLSCCEQKCIKMVEDKCKIIKSICRKIHMLCAH